MSPRDAPAASSVPAAAAAASTAASVASTSDSKKGYLGLDRPLPDVTAARRAEILAKFPHFPMPEDQTAQRKEYVVRLPGFVEDFCRKHVLRDERDMLMLACLTNLCCTVWPLMALLYCRPSHALGLFCVGFNMFMWLQRFILMLHYSQHKPLFARHLSPLRRLMPWLVAPFFGIPPGMYRAHHVVMHHRENNILDKDLSSTEPYQRDSLPGWLHYLMNYYFCIVALPFYAIRRRRWSVASEVITGCSIWMCTIAWLFRTGSGIFAIYGLIVPFFIASVAMMFGNWSQHIFVHPTVATMEQKLNSIPFNCALTINCMNHMDNQYTFNDGYHITHHLHPACHWTQLVTKFLSELELYAEHDPIIFNKTCFFEIGFFVFYARYVNEDQGYRWLYNHYVHLTKEKRSFEEVKKELKARLAPIQRNN